MAGVSSEWHEQVEFSELYFEEHKKCREQQRTMNLVGWSYAVGSKISVAQGILDDDEKKRCVELNEEIDFNLNNYNSSLDYEEKVGKVPLDLMSLQMKNKLKNCLCRVECEVDTMVNGHMNFLNLAKKVSIKGM